MPDTICAAIRVGSIPAPWPAMPAPNPYQDTSVRPQAPMPTSTWVR